MTSLPKLNKASFLKNSTLNWLFLITSLLLAGLLLTYWQSLLIGVINLQQALHQQLRMHVTAVAQAGDYGGLLLVITASAYGVFHAVGPGHGKAILSTYLSTQSDVQMKRGIILSLCGSLLQSLFAVVLVSVTVLFLQISLANINQQEWWFEAVSYALVALLGAIVTWRSLIEVKTSRRQKSALSVARFTPVAVAPVSEPVSVLQSLQPRHDSHCGCQRHIPAAKTGSWKEQLPLVLAMAARPCTGALIVLTYAYIVKIYAYGVLAVMVMGLGTGLSVAAMAYIVVKFRDRMLSWLKSTNSSKASAFNIGTWIKIAGGILLLTIGCLLLSTLRFPVTQHPIF